MKRQDQLNNIQKWLGSFKYHVELGNAVNYTDINLVAEDLLEVLLRQVYGWQQLENLNQTQQNYPGIDLSDSEARVAVQVTSQADSAKVRDMLEKVRDYQHYKHYDRFVLFVVGRKQRRYTADYSSITGEDFSFNTDKDILDFNSLIRAIHALDDNALTDVYDYLDQQLGTHVPSHPPPQRVVGNVLHLPAFEGRVEKLAELERSIVQDGVRLTQLCGPTGRGKSALVTHFINRDRLFASIVFVSLRSQPFLLETVLELLAKTLPHNRSERLGQVRRESQETGKLAEAVLLDCIGEHKTLVVLDNLEDALINNQFKPEYEALSTFVSRVVELDNHACQLLITSQKPLDPTALGDSRGSLLSAHEVSLEVGLSETEGIKLLRDLGDEKSGLWTATDELLRQLVNDCEGIPARACQPGGSAQAQA